MSSSISNRDKQDIDKFIKFLCIKSTQIVVQGRIGKPISTVYSPSFRGSEWFNLSIKDYPDINKEAKSAIQNGNPNIDHSFVIEVSLKTSDAEALVLEVWSIDYINKCVYVHIRQEVYNRITLLLKSLVCLSRTTPAFKLSRSQGNEFVMCYKVYTGKISFSGLGEGFRTLPVGKVGTPIGTYNLSAAYRTVDNLHVSQQKTSSEAIMPFELYDDYFCASKPVNSAKPCCNLQSRLRTCSETSDGQPDCPTESNMNSPSYNIFNTSLSRSPLKRGGSNEEDKATFTIGTPPGASMFSRKSLSSPILAKSNRRRSFATSPLSECSTSSKHGQQSPNSFQRSSSYKNRNKRDSFSHTKVSSAPALPTFDGFLNRRGKESSVDDLKQTTYRHWSNSNVTKITAGRNLIQAGTKLSQVGTKTDWTSGLNILATPLPPLYKTGAFIRAIPDDDKTEETKSIFDTLSISFNELLNVKNDDDDSSKEASHPSSSVTSLESDDRSTASRGSSSDISSKPSSEILKQPNDDFVLVDLKPAFARNFSPDDLSAFYHEFKHAPELAMFEGDLGMETEETLLELTKQLDDFEKDIDGFDEFIRNLPSE